MAKLYCTECGNVFDGIGIGEQVCDRCAARAKRSVEIFWLIITLPIIVWIVFWFIIPRFVKLFM